MTDKQAVPKLTPTGKIDLLLALQKAIDIVQSLAEDRACSGCEHFISSDETCSRWQSIVPADAQPSGCDEWEQSIPF